MSNYNNSWFLDEISKQPTLSAKIRTWLQLEYKIFFEPTTSAPKIPTPLWVTVCHIKQLPKSVPDYIEYKSIGFIRSFAWHFNCYKQFWRLPNIIKGYQHKLVAEKEWHEHFEQLAEDKTNKLEAVLEKEVGDYYCHTNRREPTDEKFNAKFHKDMKWVYEKYEVEVPNEYLTIDQQMDSLIDQHESWLGSGGIGDFDHIHYYEEEAERLLGGFDAKRK